MDKKQLTPRTLYPVGSKCLPIPYINDGNTKGKFDWDADEPLVKVVREYLSYIARKPY